MGTLTVTIRIDGVRETLAAFRRLDKGASAVLRKRTLELSETLADRVRAAGAADTRQTALVAPTVRARRDRVPAIAAGGGKKVGSKKARAGDLLYGTEFGMNRRTGWYALSRFRGSKARQFRPHRGRASYWFFKTVEENAPEISAAWRAVADDVLKDWSSGGPAGG